MTENALNGIAGGLRVRRTDEAGSYLVLAAFILVALMLTGALAVDISRKYQIEQKAQDVADAAAMAGAALLPDAARAESIAVVYIQQAAGAWYIPQDSDIQIVVSTDNRAGTVGVLVRAAWDPIIMPAWLIGAPTYGVSRYAIAVMSWETSVTTYVSEDTFGNFPNGPWAIFVGDTSIASSTIGNSIKIIGNAHFNDTLTLSTHAQNSIEGTLDAVAFTGGGGITPVTGPILPKPAISSELYWDATLDENNAAQKAYYTVPSPYRNNARQLLDPDGTPVPGVFVAWDPGNNKWLVYADYGGNITTAGNTAEWGNGFDLNIVGQADLALPNAAGGGSQLYWQGSIQSTKLVTVTTNNAELRTVQPGSGVEGRDNPSLAFNAGTTLGPNTPAFDNGGNAINVYGVLYTEGRLVWTGNMNNYNAGAQGSAGNYDAVGNGFIKGSVVAGSLFSSGNNFKVYYDGALSQDLPVINPIKPSLPQYSTPTVWLHK
jgi:Flp pilus assembly protein TadG